jgi:uncharacterized membrane protein
MPSILPPSLKQMFHRIRKNPVSTGLKLIILLCLVLGIFWRFYQLDGKVYWIDEVNTSLRSLGYTRSEVIQTVFTGDVIPVTTLQAYQKLSSTKTWADTWTSLTGTAEHTPLYFLLMRAWAETFGTAIATMRIFSAFISLVIFPSLYLFCRELFRPLPTRPLKLESTISGLAIALVAISPLHVLYAQEARPYSLLTVITLLSSATLLKALRSRSRTGWIWYGATLAAGLYTHLLFSVVAIAHVLYMSGLRLYREVSGWQYLSYVVATGAGGLTLVPWLLLLIKNWGRVQETTASLADQVGLFSLFNKWLLSVSRIFFGQELGTANLLLTIFVLYALYRFCRTTPRQVWLMVLTLIAVNFLALAIPDVVLGGGRSIRLRYLFPAVVGLEVAIAYYFTQAISFSRRGFQKLVPQVIYTIFLIGGIYACAVSSQAYVWWNKSVPRSGYYLPVSQIINQRDRPLILSDGRPSDTIAFSYWLRSDAHFQLFKDTTKSQLNASRPNISRPNVAEGFPTIFLLNPSQRLRNQLKRQGWQATVLYTDRSDSDGAIDRLWKLEQ